MLAEYESCMLCPRACGVNRNNGERGVCGVSSELYIARAALHHWEEPCISGERGSGAVFFSGCSLKCVFCQNYELSHGEYGKRVGIERLAEIFFELEEKGAHNINLVTPDHYIPSIALAMREARDAGLKIPYVLNMSGYETPEAIGMLSGLADIYLVDFKYMDSKAAERYSCAPDYPEAAGLALKEMSRQQPVAVFDEDGMMQRGIIVRHLLMPGMLKNAKVVLSYVYEKYGNSLYLSIMRQFTPMKRLDKYPEINRSIKRREYERLIEYALDIGITRAFIQEGGTDRESFIPIWDNEGV